MDFDRLKDQALFLLVWCIALGSFVSGMALYVWVSWHLWRWVLCQ